MQWSDVYADEFVPEMRLLGHPWKVPAANKSRAANSHDDAEASGGAADAEEDGEGSISTWYRGRAEALRLMAKEKLGEDAKPF
eukprot:6473738-Prymnesium_polylepis.1